MQKIILNSADVPVSDQVDYFVRTWAKGYEVRRPANPVTKTVTGATPGRGAGFDLDVVISQIGDSIFHGGRFDPFLVNRGGVNIPPDMPGLMIVAFLYGDGVVGIGDEAKTFRRGDVIVYDRAKPFHFNGASRHKQLSVVVPYNTFGREVPSQQSLWILRSNNPMAGIIHYHLRELSKAVQADLSSRAQILLAGFKAFLCEVFDLKIPPETRMDVFEHKRKLIKRFVRGHLDDPGLGVDLLMNEFGVSRASLYRLFEECGGVAFFIRRCRLERAYGLLSTAGGDRTGVVGSVADQLCFYDAAHFTRSFKARFGICPRDVCGIAHGVVEAAGRVDPELRSYERSALALVG